MRILVSDKLAEGLYLRTDNGEHLGARAKLVRPEFMQTLEEHWSRKHLVPNKIVTETLVKYCPTPTLESHG